MAEYQQNLNLIKVYSSKSYSHNRIKRNSKHMKSVSSIKIYITGIFLCLVFSCSENNPEQDIEKHLEQSRDASKQLGSQLKGELKAGLKSQGPVESIAICNVEAEIIASNVSKDANLEVGRTSLKVRNPSNTPDAWEKEKLIYFEQQIQTGMDGKTLEVYEVINEDNQKWFRYMKAIPTSEVCVVCHGETIAQPIKQRLEALYPDDKATGYQVGDLRGAFTVKTKL